MSERTVIQANRTNPRTGERNKVSRRNLLKKQIDLTVWKTLAKVLEKAEVRANAIRHTGFHRDGLRPETSIGMYKTLVRPILEYAAEALSFKHYYFTERKCTAVEEPPEMIKRIEKLQNRILKKLICCPKNTHPAVVRILTGVMPMSARIDMLKLRYFWKLHHNQKDNIAHVVYKGLRKNFLRGSVGFVHEIFNICCKYDRMDLWHGTVSNNVALGDDTKNGANIPLKERPGNDTKVNLPLRNLEGLQR